MPNDPELDGVQNVTTALAAARDREQATREILKVISQSRDDEKPVFDVILDNAARLCKAPLAAVGLVDETRTHYGIVASRGTRSKFLDSPAAQNSPLDSPLAAARAIRDMQPVQVEDVAEDALYHEGHPVRVATVEIEGARTFLAVPLIQDGSGIGVIILYRSEVRPFSAAEIALVETFAEQAVIAIENVRQFRTLQTRLEHEAATTEILEVISQSRDDEMPVLEMIVRTAARLCDAPLVGLHLVNEARTHHRLTCVWGPDTGVTEIGSEWDLQSPLQVATSIREARLIHTPDLADDQLYRDRHPGRVLLVEGEGIRTFLSVPLIRDGVALGCFNLNRHEVKPFSDADIALIRTFAEQAVIAIENVRQFRQVQTRLEREAATREILEAISESRADEGEVFDVMLSNAARLCKAPIAMLLLVNDAGTHFALRSSVGETLRSMTPGDVWPLTSTGPVSDSIHDKRTIHIHDLAETEDYLSGDEAHLQLVDAEGLRTRLVVPLVSGDRSFGCIVLTRREVLPFDPDDIALVETFAEQAVIAIENARQFREVQTRLEREAATREILEVISQSRDDEKPVFDIILKNACRLCGSQLAFMAQLDETGEYVVCPAQRGTSPEFAAALEQHRTPLATSPLGSAVAMRERRVVRVDDIADDELYRSGNEFRVFMVEAEGIRSLLVVPLISGNRGIGAILLYRREVDPFTDEDAALVQTFAEQAVIAIDNVRQFRDLQTRLAREAASTEILKVISQSRDDEAPVFDIILRSAARLCDAHAAALALGRPGDPHQSMAASYEVDPATVDLYDQGHVSMDPDVSLAARAIVSGEVVHVRDIADTDGYREGLSHFRSVVDDTGIRTNLFVPLLTGDGGIGALILFRKEVRAYSDDEIALVKTFAAQAVIAIENVRQFRELQTRLEREKASREILSVISQSRDDEMPVFQAILKQAERLCEAEGSGLQLLNEAGTHLIYMDYAGYDGGSFPVGTEFDLSVPMGQCVAVRENRVVHIADLKDTELYRQGHEGRRKLVDVEGTRTHLHVPLMRGGKAFGNITLGRKEPKPFTADEIALVETFAAQAVIAIENVRQFRELQTRLEREAATRDILQVINQSRSDTEPVFKAILENASRLCKAPLAFLAMADEARTRVTVPASLGAREAFAKALEFLRSQHR